MTKTQALIAALLATGLSASVTAFAKDATPAFAQPSAVRCCAAPEKSQPLVEPAKVRCCAATAESTLPDATPRFGTTVVSSRIFW